MKQRIREFCVCCNHKFEATVSPAERCDFVGVKFEARHVTGIGQINTEFFL